MGTRASPKGWVCVALVSSLCVELCLGHGMSVSERTTPSMATVASTHDADQARTTPHSAIVQAFLAGAKFQGVKMVPCGAHIITTTLLAPDRSVPTVARWVFVKPGAIEVARWEAELGRFCTLQDDEEVCGAGTAAAWAVPARVAAASGGYIQGHSAHVAPALASYVHRN